MKITKVASKEHWGKGVLCQCNHPDPLICHECEESTGVCYCKCHELQIPQKFSSAEIKKASGK